MIRILGGLNNVVKLVGIWTMILIAGLSPGTNLKPEKPKITKILFVGNSHTSTHDLPGLVASNLQTSGRFGKVSTETISVTNLKQLEGNTIVDEKIKSGGWSYVVLQGQEISMSHKYTYSTETAVHLAKIAKASGAKVLLFAEWPRKGIDETEYIYNIYAGIAKNSGATVVRVGHVFDEVLKKNPKINLWSPDGNHSSPSGAYLAACTFYFAISGVEAKKPTAPASYRVTTALQDSFHAAVIKIIKGSMGKGSKK